MEQPLLAGIIGVLLGSAAPAWLFAQRLARVEAILSRVERAVNHLQEERLTNTP